MDRSDCLENVRLIWLDQNINEQSENYVRSIHLFQTLVQSIRLCSNLDQFSNLIQSSSNEKIFLIVSGSLGEKLSANIDRISILDSVYVYCTNQDYHENWAKNIRKVQGVFTQIKVIYETFRRDLRRLTNDSISISISPTNELDQSFRASMLLRDVLIHSPANLLMKKEFVKFCRQAYENNPIQLSIIDQFENDTENLSPIQWFTRECFLSSMIHKALRIDDTEILHKLAFVIGDIHRQIADLYQKSTDTQTKVVYYGQGLNHEQLEQLKKSIDGRISFKTFLLTTVDREISYQYALQSENDPTLTPVLFHIKIDRTNSSFPFALLGQFDYFCDTDQRVLFSHNPLFHIESIQAEDQRLWQVNLNLIDGEGSIPNNGWISLGKMMMEMNHLEKAKAIFNLLLKDKTSTDHEKIALLHRHLGWIHQRMGDYDNAFTNYEKQLNIRLSYLPLNHPSLPPSFLSVGAILQKLNQYKLAMDYIQRAIDYSRQSSNGEPSLMAIYHIDIGRIYYQQNDRSRAREYFQHALEYQQKSSTYDRRRLEEIRYYLSLVSGTV